MCTRTSLRECPTAHFHEHGWLLLQICSAACSWYHIFDLHVHDNRSMSVIYSITVAMMFYVFMTCLYHSIAWVLVRENLWLCSSLVACGESARRIVDSPNSGCRVPLTRSTASPRMANGKYVKCQRRGVAFYHYAPRVREVRYNLRERKLTECRATPHVARVVDLTLAFALFLRGVHFQLPLEHLRLGPASHKFSGLGDLFSCHA